MEGPSTRTRSLASNIAADFVNNYLSADASLISTITAPRLRESSIRARFKSGLALRQNGSQTKKTVVTIAKEDAAIVTPDEPINPGKNGNKKKRPRQLSQYISLASNKSVDSLTICASKEIEKDPFFLEVEDEKPKICVSKETEKDLFFLDEDDEPSLWNYAPASALSNSTSKALPNPTKAQSAVKNNAQTQKKVRKKNEQA
jgi:hypothetical protein